jgi:hypothetical protein
MCVIIMQAENVDLVYGLAGGKINLKRDRLPEVSDLALDFSGGEAMPTIYRPEPGRVIVSGSDL